jgi:hypothetical protein
MTNPSYRLCDPLTEIGCTLIARWYARFKDKSSIYPRNCLRGIDFRSLLEYFGNKKREYNGIHKEVKTNEG